jgi:glycine cleavage system H protein
MEYPKELKYQKTDEWVKVEGGMATIGISDYAQDSLYDVVFVEFEVEAGDTDKTGNTLATIESVKAAAEVVFPVSGSVVEVNEKLPTSPESLNEAPYGKGWLCKIKMSKPEELDNLLDAKDYEAFCKDR